VANGVLLRELSRGRREKGARLGRRPLQLPEKKGRREKNARLGRRPLQLPEKKSHIMAFL
jgi:hypothetical protein